MSRQIPEAIYQSALRMDPKSILSLCRTNKQYNKDLCNNESFWSDKLSTDFSKDPLFTAANQKLIDDVPNRMRYQIFYNPKEQDIEDAIDAEVDERDMSLSLFLTKRSDLKGLEDAVERLSYLNREDLINPFVKEITDKKLDYKSYIDKSEPENFSMEEFKLFKMIIFSIYRGRLATHRGDYDIIDLSNKIAELGEQIDDEENFDEENYDEMITVFDTYNDALINKLRVAEKYSSILSDEEFLRLIYGSEEVMAYLYEKKLSLNVIKRLFDIYINNDGESQGLIEVLLEEYFGRLYYSEEGYEVIPIPFIDLLGKDYKRNKDLWKLILELDFASHFVPSTEKVRIYSQSYEELIKTNIDKPELKGVIRNISRNINIKSNDFSSGNYNSENKNNIRDLFLYVGKL